jgi:hypothetical protein
MANVNEGVPTADVFSGGTRSIVQTLRPRFAGWIEEPVPPVVTSCGGIARLWWHAERRLSVISAVEVATDPHDIDRGPEYHLSISRLAPAGPARCSSEAAHWVLRQFGLDGAEEDNHVPYGVVRNFWRAVADPLIGLACACKAEEPAIIEDKGDFVWRPAPNQATAR